MAATSVTILSEMFHEFLQQPVSEGLVEKYLHALDYAPGMDELSLNDWLELNGALESDFTGQDIAAMAHTILATQAEKWTGLGEPACHEDWVKAKWEVT